MYFLGDVHGKIDLLKEQINNYDISDINIIQVGDFGVGFPALPELGISAINVETLNDIGNFLKARNINMYVIRGNHDDPSYFEHWSAFGNIHLVPDYTYMNIEGNLVLLIGGGISPDRSNRIKNYSWWENETIKYKSMKYKKVDIVVTHVPLNFMVASYESKIGHWLEKDEMLAKDLEREKTLLTKIESELQYKHWISGHFHCNTTEFINNKKYYIVNELSYICVPPIY